jgi:short subunit dehydrogenase-like uncharacterized protein
MSKAVVVYGASGYTGRLICEYLREYNLPFTAAGRSGERVQQTMDNFRGWRPPTTTWSRSSTRSRR